MIFDPSSSLSKSLNHLQVLHNVAYIICEIEQNLKKKVQTSNQQNHTIKNTWKNVSVVFGGKKGKFKQFLFHIYGIST